MVDSIFFIFGNKYKIFSFNGPFIFVDKLYINWFRLDWLVIKLLFFNSVENNSLKINNFFWISKFFGFIRFNL